MDVLVLAAFGGMKLGLQLKVIYLLISPLFFSINQFIVLSIKCQKIV